MTKRPTISNIASGYASTTTLNNNFEALRDAFDNTLSLDGSTPNAMQADLDMNGNDIVNAASIVIDGQDVVATVNAALAATQAAADATLTALDSLDDRYLGQKASDPATDNEGDALVAGALYFNTTDEVMKVYEGSTWVAAYASLSGAMVANNNLSDVASVSASRTNLGLGTAAVTDSTAYATAAQGALADSAVQADDNVTLGDVTVDTITGDGSSLTGVASDSTQTQATWETGTGTIESIVSPAKVKAAIAALGVPSTGSVSSSGYIDIAGLRIQWGSFTSTTDGSQTISFDTAFPNSCLGVISSGSAEALGIGSGDWTAWSITTSGFTMNRNDGIAGSPVLTYLAYGY